MRDRDITQTEMFRQTAAEARAASRKYWAKGGPADRKYPVHPDVERMWPIGIEGDVELADLRRSTAGVEGVAETVLPLCEALLAYRPDLEDGR